MDWLAQNWIWVLFAVAFVAMHLFGHGGHGGHGSGSVGRSDASDLTTPGPARARPEVPPADSNSQRH